MPCMWFQLLLSQPTLQAKIEEFTLSRRRQMCEVNSRRCKRQPVYGRDLVEAVKGVCHPRSSWLVCVASIFGKLILRTRIWVDCIISNNHFIFEGTKLSTFTTLSSWKTSSQLPTLDWRWSGHSACLRHQTSSLSWTEQSTLLAAALPTLEERLDQLSEVIKRLENWHS